jgi:membrane-associated protease RseP (regulator of RpoE activity)
MRYSCIAAAIPLWACFALILLIDRSSSFVMPKQLQVGTTNAIDLRDPTLQTSFSKISNHANCKRMQTPSRQYRPTTALQVTAPSAAVAMAVAAFPPLGSLLVLALIVLVHEAGHYLAAKSFGITVEEFSVGVGPKLFGFEAGNDQFNVRALPLGGYVRFPENYNATLVRELELARMNDNSEKPPPPPPKEQEKQQPTSLTASPIIRQVMNFLILGKAEQQRRKQDEKQKLLQEEQEQKNRPWWKRSFSNPVPTSAKPKTTTIRSNRKVDEIAIEYFDDPNLLQNRPWAQRAVVLSMGVVFNLLLSYALCFGEIKWSANGLPQAVFEPGAVVSSIRSDSASRGLLQPGDVIVGINGNEQIRR